MYILGKGDNGHIPIVPENILDIFPWHQRTADIFQWPK
jgi:hypothetical protein